MIKRKFNQNGEFLSMKHQMLTSKIIFRMAIVLVFIAIFNFGFSHLFLSERLSSYMEEGMNEKKSLIVENVSTIIQGELEEGHTWLDNSLTKMMNEQEDITLLAIFKLTEGKKVEQIISKGNNSQLNIDEALIEKALLEKTEQLEDKKIKDDSVRTFFVPLDHEQLLVIQANLDRQSSLEMRIIFANIFGTLAAFLLILIFLYSIFRRQLKPLGEVEAFLGEVAKGQFSRRLIVDRQKEFSWLAQRINSMVEQIEKLIQKMKEREEDRITHMAFHDDLTNLPNRRMFRARLQNEIELSEQEGDKRTFSVLFLDLDNFKIINDTLGHAFGDQFLIQITERLKKTLSHKGELFRLDSDEFTIILNHAELQNETIDEVCEQLLAALDEPILYQGESMNSSLSIGIATYPTDGTDHDALLRNADAAMFAAKNAGKKRYVHYVQNMREELMERLELEKGIREALVRNELLLHYQPQIDSETKELAGVEVLLRWEHPELGMIPPNKFIPMIERSHLINEVGEWVLITACQQNKKWQDEGFPKIKISVNVSARQFQQSNFVSIVENALNLSGLDPNYLMLELTESTAMENVNDSYEKMLALKRLGVEVAIDDFGTGYSSLRYLKSFPIDTLKIDREFISEVDKKGNGVEVVTAIIALAHSLNLGLVAEGVETKRQLEFLKNRQCYIIQGFLYSRPLSAVDFEKWVRNDKFESI